MWDAFREKILEILDELPLKNLDWEDEQAKEKAAEEIVWLCKNWFA